MIERKKMKEKMNVILLWLRLIIKLLINYFKLNDDITNNNLICKNISEEIIDLANIKLTVIGKSNIKEIEKPLLITANHRSFFDIFLLIVALGKTIPFAAAKKLYRYPMLNKYIKSIDCISVDPYTTDISELKHQLKEIREHLDKHSLILFPEGECNYEDNQIKEFKKGGFFSLNKTETYIIPTYIHIGNFKRLGRWCVPENKVIIVFGEAFKPNEIACNKITSAYLANYTQEKVNELKNKFTL